MDAAPSIPTSGTHSHLLRWLWFWAWALVGGAGAFGVVSLIPIAMLPALIAGLAISRIKAASRSAFGLIAGAGFLSLGVAYIQRDGPGTTCWHSASGFGCDQHLNPIPWLVVGVALVVGSVIAQSRRHT